MIQKDCKCDNPNCPPNCAFTPKIDLPIQKILKPKILFLKNIQKKKDTKTKWNNVDFDFIILSTYNPMMVL